MKILKEFFYIVFIIHYLNIPFATDTLIENYWYVDMAHRLFDFSLFYC